jgi:hypothetical protein
MEPNTTRRAFLRGSAAAAVGLAAADAAATAQADEPPKKPQEAKHDHQHDHGSYPRDRPGVGGPLGSATDSARPGPASSRLRRPAVVCLPHFFRNARNFRGFSHAPASPRTTLQMAVIRRKMLPCQWFRSFSARLPSRFPSWTSPVRIRSPALDGSLSPNAR